MGTILIETKKYKTKDDFDYKATTFVNANVFEAMIGISMAICDIENELPEDDRQKFRSDFLKILNETRNGEHYAK